MEYAFWLVGGCALVGGVADAASTIHGCMLHWFLELSRNRGMTTQAEITGRIAAVDRSAQQARVGATVNLVTRAAELLPNRGMQGQLSRLRLFVFVTGIAKVVVLGR